jgi:hypothetical protein
LLRTNGVGAGERVAVIITGANMTAAQLDG